MPNCEPSLDGLPGGAPRPALLALGQTTTLFVSAL